MRLLSEVDSSPMDDARNKNAFLFGYWLESLTQLLIFAVGKINNKNVCLTERELTPDVSSFFMMTLFMNFTFFVHVKLLSGP